MSSLEVLFTPADFAALSQRDLSKTVCVVFDVLRATSTMITALGNGAAGLLPVLEIKEALAAGATHPGALLAGERDGLRISAGLSGGVEFDLGNSPREFTPAVVKGRSIIITTTNGTRALRACVGARLTLAASFLNLGATADAVRQAAPAELVLVCSGTLEQAAYEDVLGAGALAQLLWDRCRKHQIADSAQIARRIFLDYADNPVNSLAQSRNAQRLLSRPELADDVPFCFQRNAIPLVARLGPDGWVRTGTAH